MKVSSLVVPYGTLVGLLSTNFISPVQAKDKEKDKLYAEISHSFIAQPFYSDAYLSTLSEGEIGEALKPRGCSVDDPKPGRCIIQQDTGNGQSSSAFVPNDPRNAKSNPGSEAYKLTYGVKQNYCTDLSKCAHLSEGLQDEWFNKPFSSWFDNASCSVPKVTLEVTVDSSRPGVVEHLYNEEKYDPSLWEADITSVGFFSPSEFGFFADPDIPGVLGVAFTYLWTDGLTGEFTDINGDGKHDTAFVEVYYNSNFTWSTEPVADKVSFPWVATHEVGHALGLDHFGTMAILTKGNGEVTLEATPKAIMNAFYNSQDPVLDGFSGTDARPICDIYGSWDPPNRS